MKEIKDIGKQAYKIIRSWESDGNKTQLFEG
jgi:hypothetical protein